MTQNKKLVLFDIDQTLLTRVTDGSSQMFERVFNLKASEDDIDNTGKTEILIINQVLEKIAPHLLPLSNEILSEAYKEWAIATQTVVEKNPPQILPGVITLLNLLVDSPEIELGLLTGNSHLRAEAKLTGAKIDHYFRNSNGSLAGAFGNEAMERKELIAIAGNKYNLNKDQIIIVDDSLIGAAMAKELDVKGIFLATGSASLQQLQTLATNVFLDLDADRAHQVAALITS